MASPRKSMPSFAGLWETTFGRMRLTQEGARVRGHYSGGGPATLEGRAKSGALDFRYREPRAQGQGRFLLSEDARTFEGRWLEDGQSQWQPWIGQRVEASEGLRWLVVLEAHWQRSLAEPEYAFGQMLREVFARLPGVRVRHRFFHDRESLVHWCHELRFLAEPAIVVVASHGEPAGLSVHGRLVESGAVIGALGEAPAVCLLHFSSCLVGEEAGRSLPQRAFPISGYATRVDWNVSVLIEIAYLDLILNRGLEPREAAAALPGLLRFSGDAVQGDSPYPAAGFRFHPAG